MTIPLQRCQLSPVEAAEALVLSLLTAVKSVVVMPLMIVSPE